MATAPDAATGDDSLATREQAGLLQSHEAGYWKLSSPPFAQVLPSRRLLLQAKVVDWVYVNIVIEEPKGRALSRLESALLGSSENSIEPATNDAIDELLALCRQKYSGGVVPPFAATLGLDATTSGEGDTGYEITERISPDLVDALRGVDELLGPALAGRVSLVPRTRLETVPSPGLFFLPNTRLVLYGGRSYVAKGPIYPSRAVDDFLDARNLLELAGDHPSRRCHRHIMQAPATFVIVSEDDERVCGFLTPFVENGNLDIYAAKLRATGALTPEKLTRWFRQLVDAMAFLVRRGTWHGDMKPDNILVDADENIVLIDFTRKFTTFATASPELRRHCASHFPGREPEKIGSGAARTSDCVTGVPASWSRDAIARSEVYSVGRTMYLVCEGTSMVDLYRKYGWMRDDCYDFPTTFSGGSGGSSTPEPLRPIILQCVAPEPSRRPTLEQLAKLLEDLAQ